MYVRLSLMKNQYFRNGYGTKNQRKKERDVRKSENTTRIPPPPKKKTKSNKNKNDLKRLFVCVKVVEYSEILIV